ncbi:hypothetical protein BU23DRAFT_551523 [Bimuria novae-zelandiae CBS 107.79]|uniref:NmrA-like domain-containing protein n=1 Tax=Bimuria novae-zelandiae CBS 107.79 TaxID=1447943 RepID=A0A6A5VNS7_9PLEO|nr:hypothetical protein BU23DRAFT_551523 [Bimuria novae-zelandiae CBS 107.79]
MEIIIDSLPTHLWAIPLFVDVKNNTTGVHAEGKGKMTLTYSRDISEYVAAKLLGFEKWEQRYYISGDIETWNEVVSAAGKGVKSDVSCNLVERL